ncbi:hypothetical protein OG741_20920 [Streptomyces sp. NBC_01410]|uniref:hypothetical protein n=1 Tax=Streptomyces sp. NBC_01410 TaxID=2903856 RepID=UPI003254D094
MSKEAREALVLAHMASENRHAHGGTRKTFGQPRYETVATGQLVDGPAADATGRRVELVCERGHFAPSAAPATVPARLGLAPSLPLPA